jgi:hypothetical protein
MMGRLNASNIRYDVGRGGMPELTPQDVAGAVGMIKDPLARAVFCWMWWEDGSQLTSEQVQADLRARLYKEQASRAMEWKMAELALSQAEGDYAARRRPTDDDKAAVSRLRAQEKRAKAHAWPGSPSVYPLIIKGVLDEYRSPRNCPDCGGRGNVASQFGPRDCARCDASGKVAHTNVKRAAALRIDESAFRRLWSPVYEWAFSMVRDLEQEAARHLAAAIGSRDDSPEARETALSENSD